MSEIKVNSIKGVGASTAAITVNNTDGSCTVNNTQRQGKNLIINGAMLVAQRATTYTGADNYNTVDRFKVIHSGLNEDVTSTQVDISSGTTPYSLGFRKAWKITNGNQSAGAGSGDLLSIQYRIEAQDLATSGWDYKSTSSFIALSFYVKSSVAQSFGGFIRSHDSTQMTFPFETGALSADTWTKITRIIPGNGALDFNNDNGTGMEINISQFWGTDYTTSSKPLDTWGAYSNDARLRDFPASTWYTTNDATFEITGLQLEVSDHVTDFEHRSFGQELALCQRYFYKEISSQASTIFAMIAAYTTSNGYGRIDFPVPMRADGSGISLGYSALSDFQALISGTTPTPTQFQTSNRLSSTGGQIFTKTSSAYTVGQAGVLRSANANAFLSFDAEL